MSSIILQTFHNEVTSVRAQEIVAIFDRLANGEVPAPINIRPQDIGKINFFLRWLKEQDWSEPIELSFQNLELICGDPKSDLGKVLRDCLKQKTGGGRGKVATYARNKQGLQSLIAALSVRIKIDILLAEAAASTLKVQGLDDQLQSIKRYEE